MIRPQSTGPRRLRALTTVLGCLLSFAAPVHAKGQPENPAPHFLPGFPDVPLMRGLDVDQAETVVFDKPNGRILEASAAGPVPVAEFVAYYTAALLELGWYTLPEGGPDRLSFERDGEKLQIEFAPSGDTIFARFFLSPH